MARESFAFKIPLREILPTSDPAWRTASLSLRLEARREAVRLGLEVKDAELAAGLDRSGRPLAAISQRTRENRRSAMGTADPNAPPLTPAYGLSRTRSLLDARIEGDSILFFWRVDPVTGQHWGRTLGYHRDGKGRLPVRDVIGLSAQSKAIWQARMAAWWTARKFGPVTSSPRRPAGPPPGAMTYSFVEKYRPKNPSNAIPENNRRVGQIAIEGHHYTLANGSAASLRRMIANGSWTGFRQIGGTR